MTTTEKRGFRLPWGGETRKPEDEDESGPGAAASAVLSPDRDLTPARDLAPALAPSSGASVRSGSILRRGQVEELGRGPFDLAPADEPDVSGASASLVDVVEPAPKPTPEPMASTEAMTAVETPAPDEPESPAAPPAWPEMDRRGSARHLASDVPPPPIRAATVADAPKKVNPLVAGLVKAMRDAARAAREETTARMRADAAARADQIRLEAVAVGASLKKQADEDVAGIREWSRTETARIKAETDRRIADRRARLLEDAQQHAAATERLNGDLKTAIAAFEGEMERFFERLLKEEDPARLATLAERLPEPPTFARLGEAPVRARTPKPRAVAPRKPATDKEGPAARLAPDAAAAAEAEAILGLDEEVAHAAGHANAEPPVAGDPAVEEVTSADVAPADVASAELATAEPTAVIPAAEAVPADGADGPVAADPSFEPPMDDPWGAVEPAAAIADPDTNGHVAPVADEADDAESIAAWADALAAIRAQASEPEPDEPDAIAPDATDGVVDEPDALDLGAFDAPADSLLGVLAGASRINSPDDLSPEERIALLGFDEPAPGEEPAPMTATPVVAPATEAITRVVVEGLASVAEISAFKSALVGVPGVNSVSVTTGNDGDFVFSVVHATTTDLRLAVPGFARFGPKLAADEGAVLTYSLAEPGS